MSGPAGTASVTSWPWKNGRPWKSHLRGTPAGNQAPPVASVTDQRAQAGDVSRSCAAGAGRTTSTVSPATVIAGSAASTSMVRRPTPRGSTATAQPPIVTRVSVSVAESNTTSTRSGCRRSPAAAGRPRPAVAAAGAERDDHDAGRDSSRAPRGPHRAGRRSPVPAHRRPGQGVRRPADKLQPLVAPVVAPLGPQPPVVGDRLDRGGREVERLRVTAAHGPTLSQPAPSG